MSKKNGMRILFLFWLLMMFALNYMHFLLLFRLDVKYTLIFNLTQSVLFWL